MICWLPLLDCITGVVCWQLQIAVEKCFVCTVSILVTITVVLIVVTAQTFASVDSVRDLGVTD